MSSDQRIEHRTPASAGWRWYPYARAYAWRFS
jgi:hypothetical protein